MSPAETRKQLLIAECEFARAQLVGDVAALTADVHAIADCVRSFGAIASSATMLVSDLAIRRRNERDNTRTNPSWLQTILNGVGLVAAVWLVFQPQSRATTAK